MPSVKFADDVTEHIFEKDEREHFKVSSTYGPRPTYEFWSPPIRVSRRDDYNQKKLFTSSSDSYIPKGRTSHEILRSYPSSVTLLNPTLKSQYQHRTSSVSDIGSLRRDYSFSSDTADYGPKYGRSWSTVHSKLSRVPSLSPASSRSYGGIPISRSTGHIPSLGTTSSSSNLSFSSPQPWTPSPSTFRRSSISSWRPNRAIYSRSYSSPASYTRSSMYGYSPTPSSLIRRLHRSRSSADSYTTPTYRPQLPLTTSYSSLSRSANTMSPPVESSEPLYAPLSPKYLPVGLKRSTQISSNYCDDHPGLYSSKSPTPHHLFPYRQYAYEPYSSDNFTSWYDDWRVRWRTPQLAYQKRDKYTPRASYV